MAPPLQKEEERVEDFFYLDEQGRAAARVRIHGDRTVHVAHRAPNRHWRGGWPEGLKVLYRAAELDKASKEQWCYVTRDEQEAAFFIRQGRAATCVRFPTAALDTIDTWAYPFAGRKVLLMLGSSAHGLILAERLQKLLTGFVEKVVNVPFDAVEPGDGLWEWLERHDMDVEQLDAYVSELVSARTWNGLAPEGGERPRVEVVPVPEELDQVDDDDEAVNTHWKAFPLHALPVVLADHIAAGSEALHCDPAYVALPCICAAGGALGNAVVMRIKATWWEPSVFWGVLIADSSTMKSPAADIAKEPLARLQGELFHDFELEHFRWEKAKRTELGDSPNGMPGPDGDRPDDGTKKPVARRVIVEDITVEKLAQILFDNPRGVTLVRDELAGWFGSFTRYMSSKGGGSTLPFWLEVFRARGMMIDRKSGDMPTLYIPRAAVSVFGTIQPTTFVSFLSDEFVESGFASRLLMAMPPKTPKAWSEAIIPDEVSSQYNRLIRELFNFDAPHSHRRDWQPREVEFSRDGKAAWVEFYNRWADMQATSHGETAYALAKLEAYCARLALLIGTIEFICERRAHLEVQASDVESSVQVVEWFAQEAQRVYAMLRTPVAVMEATRLLEFIQARGGSMTARDLFRSNPSKFGSVAAVRARLDKIVAEGKGRWVNKPTGPKGGRPTVSFMAIPDETETRHNHRN